MITPDGMTADEYMEKLDIQCWRLVGKPYAACTEYDLWHAAEIIKIAQFNRDLDNAYGVGVDGNIITRSES